MNNTVSPSSKIKFNESEQELFDALLDEYNDIFEHILNITEKNMFDKILDNVKAILGPKKILTYTKMSIARVLSALKLSNYLPDITSLKQIKEIMISFGKKDRTNKIPSLKIDDIFSHCKECSKCFHICGEVLLNPPAFDFIICLKCRMVYKKELIHLYCKECNEEYYSYIIDDSEPEYEDFYPATWEKYHCPNFIYEEMTCPECDSMLYYNENEDLLKCFECNWNCIAKEKKWICEMCDEEFKSEVKEYIRFETKPMVNCVRDALVKKILARPAEMVCCGGDPRYFPFIHEEKGCKGILYLGLLQKKDMVICSECRLVQNLKDVIWWCPNCENKFICKNIKNNFNKNKNCYMIKPKSLMKIDTAGLFKPKKIQNFQKTERSSEKMKNIDNFKKIENKVIKMEKSITCQSLNTRLKSILSNKTDSKKNSNKSKKNEIKDIKTDIINNFKEEIDSNSNLENKEKEKSSEEEYKDKHKQMKSKKLLTSFYKKPKNFFSNNRDLVEGEKIENESGEKSLEKIGEKNNETKKEEKDYENENNNEKDNISGNLDENHDESSDETENITKTPNKINLKFSQKDKMNFYSKKREISVNQSTNLSLREMKLLSLKNQKYINKSKIKFDKSLNETNIISHNNKNLYSDIKRIDNLKSYKKDKNKGKEKNEKKINFNLNLNININNYLARSRSIKNYHTLENGLRNKTLSKSYLNLKNISSLNNNLKKEEIEPNENFIPEDFKTIKQIGEGSFGKIYCAEWTKNKKRYAMKKMILRNKIEIKKNQDQTDLVYDLIQQTNTKGVIKIYGAQCIKINSAEYHFYVLMELAEIDWEKEIKKRKDNKNYYTEGELFEILKQLVKTFAFLQRKNITHRDIKPQNILLVNKAYKVCDFGEAKVTDGNNVIHQTIKGTELYMSPILFRALNKRQTHIIHNTFKSDVFSLGMCLFLAATLTFQSLYDIRELKDMELIKNILVKYLIAKYSYDFVHILIKMLEINENLRPDFIEIEKILSKK